MKVLSPKNMGYNSKKEVFFGGSYGVYSHGIHGTIAYFTYSYMKTHKKSTIHLGKYTIFPMDPLWDYGKGFSSAISMGQNDPEIGRSSVASGSVSNALDLHGAGFQGTVTRFEGDGFPMTDPWILVYLLRFFHES